MISSKIVAFVLFVSFLSASLLQLVFYGVHLSYFFLLLALWSLFYFFFFQKSLFVFYFALFFITASVFSFYLFSIQEKNEQLRKAYLQQYKDPKLAFVKVVSDKDEREVGTFYILSLCKDDGITDCIKVRARIFEPMDFEYGDYLTLKIQLRRFENFSENFNYEKFMEARFVLLEAIAYDIKKTSERQSVLRTLYALKHKMSDRLFESLSYDNAALASGLLFGQKQALGKSSIETFNKSGLTHIVVLSGYNIGIIAGVLFFMLGFLSKFLRAFFSVLLIFLFVLMVGPEAPSVRAGIMGSLIFMAIALRRAQDSLYFLFLSGVFMVIFSPLALVFDPGFQLSYAVTLAILLFAEPIAEKVKSAPQFLKEVFSSSVVAFAFALPLVVYYTGSGSLSSVFANLLVLPIVPFAMLFSTILIFVPWKAVLLPFGLVAEFLLSGIYFFAETFAVDFMQVSFSVPEIVLVLIYFALLLYASYRLNEKRPGAVKAAPGHTAR